uniref:Hypothetical secreted peptide n=1 Tax=Glossina morsitans morsitans TaxID=37546 RepID=D3TSN5_GLOMM
MYVYMYVCIDVFFFFIYTYSFFCFLMNFIKNLEFLILSSLFFFFFFIYRRDVLFSYPLDRSLEVLLSNNLQK